jgi:hypothetical protein
VRAEEFVDGGDHVLVIVGFGAVGKGSGLDIEGTHSRGANVFTLRDGKVVRLALHSNIDVARAEFEAMRAASSS